MTTKSKPRKAAPALKAPAASVFDAATADAVIERESELGNDKLREAHSEMWDGLNFLKLIELAAQEAIDDSDNADDYAHAVGTAARAAVEKFKSAYDLIDECSTQMTQTLMRGMDAGAA